MKVFHRKNSWCSMVLSASVTEIDYERIKSAFVYEGFN